MFEGQERVFYEIESPLIPVLVDMEVEGIKVDAAALAEFTKIGFTPGRPFTLDPAQKPVVEAAIPQASVMAAATHVASSR